ncbi:MAG: hypothetical protein AB7U61_03880 [Methylocystis sp.]
MAVKRDQRRLAAVRVVLRRANCAKDDAFAKRRDFYGHYRRLREKHAGGDRREHTRA